MGKLSRLREIRRAHRGMQSDSVRVQLASTDSVDGFSIGQFVAMAGVRNIPRRMRKRRMVVSHVDYEQGIITLNTEAQ